MLFVVEVSLFHALVGIRISCFSLLYYCFDGKLAVSIRKEFLYTGETQYFQVPSWVASLEVDMYGAQGGNCNGCSAGGLGGHVKAFISVSPNDILEIRVGGMGNYASGGFNGGGGVSYYDYYNAAGGGGATDIRPSGTGMESAYLVAGKAFPHTLNFLNNCRYLNANN